MMVRFAGLIGLDARWLMVRMFDDVLSRLMSRWGWGAGNWS